MLNKLKESKLLRLGRDQNKEAASRLSVLLWVDTKFLHSRKERCAINAKPRGSSISTTDAPPALGQRPYNLFALLRCVFLSNTVFVISRIDIFCNDLSVFLDDSACGY